jgi:hypothetical protein
MGSAMGTRVVSGLLAAIVLVGWLAGIRRTVGMPEVLVPVTGVMILFVGAQTFRYVLPLTPYLLWFLWSGLTTLVSLIPRRVGAAIEPLATARIVFVVVILLAVVEHGQYLYLKGSTSPPEWIADAREVNDFLAWIRDNVSGPGAVASNNPGLVFLWTGRQAIASDDVEHNWTRWKALGVRYLVTLRPAPLPRSFLPHRTVFKTARRQLWIVEL